MWKLSFLSDWIMCLTVGIRSSSVTALKSNAYREGMEVTKKWRRDHFDEIGLLNSVRYRKEVASKRLNNDVISSMKLLCMYRICSCGRFENDSVVGRCVMPLLLMSNLSRFVQEVMQPSSCDGIYVPQRINIFNELGSMMLFWRLFDFFSGEGEDDLPPWKFASFVPWYCCCYSIGFS